jgi:hypothetical protein
MKQEDIDRVEAILRDDIKWAASNPDVGWDPLTGSIWRYGKWVRSDRADACGVCAIGAHVMRTGVTPIQKAFNITEGDVDVTARELGIGARTFLWDVYLSVADTPEEREDTKEPSEGTRLGWRLRDYGDSLK